MEKRKPAALLPLRPCHLRTEPPDLPGTPPRPPSGEPFRDAACWQRAPRDCAFGPAFLRRRNERERQRVRCVNEGYARLRDHLPRELAERRLSKVQTLRAAIGYIRHLQQLLERHARGQGGPAGPRPPRAAECNSDGESKASSAPSPCSEPDEAGS